MRKFISLSCIFLVIVSCMLLPVSAAESTFDTYFINVLDYLFPNDQMTSRCILTNTNNTVYFSFGSFNTPYYYIDLTLNIVGDIPSSIIFRYGGQDTTLNLVSIGNGLYRVYGDLPGNSGGNAYFIFNGISYSVVDFCSFHMATARLTSNTVPLEASGIYPGGEFDMSKNYGDSRPTKTTISNSEFENRDFILYLHTQDWRKYDYLEYQLYFIVDSITSIACVMGQENVPFDLSYIGDSTSDKNLYVNIRIDCRYLDRTSDDYPMVIINGNVIFDGVSLVSLMNSNGIVVLNDFSQLTLYFSTLYQYLSYYFNSLADSITSDFSSLNLWIDNQTSAIVDAINGDTSAGESFQEDVNEKDAQFDEMAAIMDSVDQPALDSINVSADSYVDSTVLASSMSGLTSVIGGPVFIDVFMMALMMATAGYVLFGKR